MAENMDMIPDEELSNIITLSDEEGNPVDFEFLDLIEYDGGEYAVMLPMEEDDGDVVILKVEESDDPELENYCSVESEETLSAVFEIFKERFKDEFNFAD